MHNSLKFKSTILLSLLFVIKPKIIPKFNWETFDNTILIVSKSVLPVNPYINEHP